MAESVIAMTVLLADAAIAVTSIVTDSGISASDFITNATSVVAHGTGRANAWIQVFLDDKYLGNQQIDGSGNWTYGLDTPQGNHTIKAHYIDLAENVVPGPVASHGMTVDTTAPTLQIQLPAGTAKGAETVYFNFSEAVSGFDASDVALSKATLTDFKMIDAAHYSATIKPVGTGAGTLSLSVADNLYMDAAGNAGTGDSESQTYQLGRVNLITNGSQPGISNWYFDHPSSSHFDAGDNSSLTGGFYADAIDPVNHNGVLLTSGPTGTLFNPPSSGLGIEALNNDAFTLEQGKKYDFSVDVRAVLGSKGSGGFQFYFIDVNHTDIGSWVPILPQITWTRDTFYPFDPASSGAPDYYINTNWTTLQRSFETTGLATGTYKLGVMWQTYVQWNNDSDHVVYDRLFLGEQVI